MSLPTFDHQELLKIQAEHLALWKARLRPELYAEIEAYVRATNDENTNRVYRGQDLIEIIREWPHLCPAFAPVGADIL